MTWPVTLVAAQPSPVGLRPMRVRDGRAWREVRTRNADWLRPWEATLPKEGRMPDEVPSTFAVMVRRMNREARAGRCLPWAITYDGAFAGQVTVGGITYGSLRAGYIGYWIDQQFAGRGVVPTAVAIACDYCLGTLHLNRIEIGIRPENAASLRVVHKLGLRDEGLRPRYLHIDGDWRDHRIFSVLRGDFPDGLQGRLDFG